MGDRSVYPFWNELERGHEPERGQVRMALAAGAADETSRVKSTDPKPEGESKRGWGQVQIPALPPWSVRRKIPLVIPQIRKLKYAQPFVPFYLELSSGRVIRIATPDHIALNDAGPGMVIFLDDDNTWTGIPGLHLAGVGTNDPRPRPNGQGQP
ncbi:MAG: hypothetical protein JO015_19965 [Verrucomicrobia bacterium]|nr:hypothetical protein [Verrucomicrobiota bacterium]